MDLIDSAGRYASANYQESIMKILTFAVGVAIAIGGVAASAPALAQMNHGGPGMDHRNDRHDDHRADNGRRSDHHLKNYRKRCTYEYRYHRKIRVCH
jgi:hypothetical protein